MNLQNADTVLARSTESRKYTTPDAIASLAASDANDLIVVGGTSKDGQGVIHCLGHDGEMRWTQTYPRHVNVVGVAARGNLICMGSESKSVYMFTPFGQLIWQDDCRSEPKAMAISASGRFTVAGLADGNINVYDGDIVAARKFAWKHRFGRPVIEVGLNADGTLVVASTEEGEIAVFTERGDLVWSKVIEAGVGAFRIAAEGDAVVVASDDGKLRYYSAEVGKSIWTVTAAGVFNDVDISRKADRVVAASKDGTVYCYDKSGNLVWKYEMGNPGENVRIAKDGKTVIVSSIDAVIHCLDNKGNLVWKHRTGSSSVVGLVVSDSGDMVVASCESGLLYFENIQVVGGLLPMARHEITLAKERGVPTFKAEKIYEEAVVALNFGDYITTAAKIRDMEKAMGPVQKPAPSPEAVVAPTPGPGPKPTDEAQNVRTKIDNVLAESEELKTRGVDVEPVENLLGEAMVLLEDGNLDDALAYVQDAREMLEAFKSEAPPPAIVAKPVAPPKPKNGKDDALKAVEKAATMLAELEETDLGLDTVRSDIKSSKDLIQNADYQRAIAAANRAVVTMEKALDPYITDCLIEVQKLVKTAEKEGIKVDEPKRALIKVRDQIKAVDFIGALATVTEVEDWLEEALKTKKPAPPPPKPAVVTPPPKASGLDALKAEMATKPKKPEEPAPPKPSIDVSKVPPGKEDPQLVLVDAEEALKAGNIAKAVEMYIQVAETAESKARAIVEEAITKAKDQVEKVQKDGFDVAEANDLIDGAWTDLNVGNYTAAIPKAMQAYEKADNAAALEIQKVIEESRRTLDMALKIGANIQAAEDLINSAETAMKKRDYKVAVEFADKGVAEVEKTSNSTVTKILEEGRVFLDKASDMGANVEDVKAQFEEAEKALDSRVFIKAHELAKKAVESAKVLPRNYVSSKLTEARTKVVAVEKMGADIMMAKNYLIKARSTLAANDYDTALKAVEKCLEETAKAPKELVNKRIALARADIEGVKAEGQGAAEVEDMIGQAEAKATGEKFEEALRLVDGALSRLKDLKQFGKDATDALFDADMAISTAKDAGKDAALVQKAETMWHEAMATKAKDPAKAKEQALEIKKLLEG